MPGTPVRFQAIQIVRPCLKTHTHSKTKSENTKSTSQALIYHTPRGRDYISLRSQTQKTKAEELKVFPKLLHQAANRDLTA